MSDNNQAVEAAVEKLMGVANRWADEQDPLQCGRSNTLRDALRATLSSPGAEVAQGVVTDSLIGEALKAWDSKRGYSDIERMRAALAATRAPVAAGVEPWTPGAIAYFLQHPELTNQAGYYQFEVVVEGRPCKKTVWLHQILEQFATQPAGAGVSVGREQDSFHVVIAGSGSVQGGGA